LRRHETARFSHVRRPDFVAAFQIGDRSGDPQHLVVATGCPSRPTVAVRQQVARF
jgi:hypothetical protein